MRVKTETGITREKISNTIITRDKEISFKDLFLNVDSSVSEVKSLEIYLRETKNQREKIKADADIFTKERRKIAKGEYEKSYEEIKEKLNLSEEYVLYASHYAPMVIAELTCSEIKEIASVASIKSIDFYEKEEIITESVVDEETQDLMDYYKGYYGFNSITTRTGLTGRYVNIGIIEQGNSSDLENRVEPHEHFEMVYGIIDSIAPNTNIELQLIGLDENTIYQTIEEMIDNGVDVFNFSWGINSTEGNYYTTFEQWIDHVSYQHNVAIVTSAGNADQNTRISAPGLAYNVITVGYSEGTAMNAMSNGAYGSGCFKPDLVANGNYSTGAAGEGTSFSAATVTGVIALMYELDPSLLVNPQAVKAILMAGCYDKANNATQVVGGSSGDLRKWQGAGILDIMNTLSIVKHHQYGIGLLEGVEEGDADTFRIIQPIYSASKINVSLAWLRNSQITHSATNSIATVSDKQDLDLFLYTQHEYTASDDRIAESQLGTSSTEKLMIEIGDFSDENKYTIGVERYSGDESVRYAYAWSTDNIDERYEWVPTDIYYVRNKNTSLYMQASGTDVIQSSYSDSNNRKWFFETINGVKMLRSDSTDNILSLGNSISTVSEWAKLSSGATGNIDLVANSDGSYSIFHEASSGLRRALGPQPNTTTSGTKLVWRYNTLDDMHWYLERINYQKGDINMNGVVNNTDVINLTNYLNGNVTFTGVKRYLADVNGDGVINNTDYTLLQNYID